MARDVRLRNFDAQFRCDLEHNTARNSAQCAGGDRRRENLTTLDDENVVSGAFGDVPCIVHHQCLVRTSQVRLNPRHHIVQVIEGFDRRIQRGRVAAARCARNDG